MTWLILMGAGFAAGIVNSMAGGGSFLTFPSLVYAGLPAVVANASSTVALVPGAVGTGFGYRSDVRRSQQAHLTAWFVVSLIGGLLGAALLMRTSDNTFRKIAPWLLLFATLLFAFGAQVSAAIKGRLHGNEPAMLVILLLISIYGGYFGGGLGIMMLAAFRLYGISDIHAMLGIKAMLAAALNAIAAVVFIVAHQIRWPETLVMMLAAIVGGYLGPILTKRMPPAVVRGIVIAVGVVMTVYFFRISAR